MIERSYYPASDLIVHVVTGDLDEDELRAVGEALYRMDPVPRLSLWDLSGARLERWSLERIRTAQSGFAFLLHGREGGKTAIVAPTDLTFAVSRQYVALSEGDDLPFEQHVFRTVEEAYGWLGVDVQALVAG